MIFKFLGHVHSYQIGMVEELNTVHIPCLSFVPVSAFPYRNDTLNSFSIQQWVANVERNPTPPEIPSRAEFTAVNVAGNAATVQFEVYRGDEHIFSDFMSLYKFEDGWKIVNKIYYSHPG